MIDDFGHSLMIGDNGAVLNIESAAAFLGISTATVRNWVKCGYLQTLDKSTRYFFHKENIEIIKSKIVNGDFKKLDKRANKAKTCRTFIPDEYAQDKIGFERLNDIVYFIQANHIDLSFALLLITLNLLKREGILLDVKIDDLAENKSLLFTNRQIKKEVLSWISETKKIKIKKDFSFLLDCDIPRHRDILGFLYQSLLAEGQKSQNGSYYTPFDIVNRVVADYVRQDSKALDPCCGTGQFLLAFSDIIKDPLSIYGIDFDEIAVKIARINILIKFKDKDFTPNIICKNTLFDVSNYSLFDSNNPIIKDFDIIATNPPWGVHFLKGDINKLKKLYPIITSLESFSYFLQKSISLLRNGGVVSFILPESILNVKMHKDIREVILKNTRIEKIIYLNRIFKNVFTPVIRLDLRKDDNLDNVAIEVFKGDESFHIDQSRWLKNVDFIFDIHMNDFDAEIINKAYRIKHVTLENNANWALGIVTGNNKEFILSEKSEGTEPIYKGKDVRKFILEKPSNYIKFSPQKFQQVAPVERYRAKEKLIYKFISKNLVFAYDDRQRLTLNSANIVIPNIPDYPIKVIAALFNSSLYQFIFQKKFSSIKVLRNHIEQMPLPLWDDEVFNTIIRLVDDIISTRCNFTELDDYIMDQFSLSSKEKTDIRTFIS